MSSCSTVDLSLSLSLGITYLEDKRLVFDLTEVCGRWRLPLNRVSRPCLECGKGIVRKRIRVVCARNRSLRILAGVSQQEDDCAPCKNKTPKKNMKCP